MLFPGAGGYWWKLVHRDTLAAAFKRTATEGLGQEPAAQKIEPASPNQETHEQQHDQVHSIGHGIAM